MTPSWVRVTSFLPNGMATLEDGREVQVVVARNGALGVRKATPEDHAAGVDQSGPISDAKYFDVSGLDQM
jgi:hypothetical protein